MVAAWSARQTLREVAFCQVTQRRVEPAHHTRTTGDQVVVTLGEQTQHGDLILDADTTQAGHALRHDRHRTSVVPVGLAALLVVQQAHPCRQRRRHINHVFTDRDELFREQGARAAGTLDRPQARLILGGPRQQSLALLTVGDHGELVADLLPVVDHDRGMRPAMRINPMMNISDSPSISASSWSCHDGQS